MATSEHNKCWLLLIFLLAFAARAAFPDTSYFFWDESVYLMHGQLFAGHEAAYSEVAIRPPLLPALLSPLALMPSAAAYELGARLLAAFLNSLVVLPVFFLTKSIFSRRSVAFAAAIIAAFLPVGILNSRWIMADALGALLALSSVTCYIIGFRSRKSVLVYAGGFLAALAVLMKFTNLLLFILLLPLLLLNLRKELKAIAVSVLVFAATLLPYLLFSLARFGSLLYTFRMALHVVSESDPVSFGFFLFLLKDSLGVLATFLFVGIIIVFRQQLFKRSAAGLYLLYCLLVTFIYSFFILNKGVVKPAGIEWEAGRFLLLFILFSIPVIACGAVSFVAFVSAIFRRSAPQGFLAVMVVVVLLSAFFYADHSLSLYPQLGRAYVPAITYEDGLRQVVKGVAAYVHESSAAEFGCFGNCPPVAYYSGKRMRIFYSIGELAAANLSSVVVFGNSSTFSGSYSSVKEFCSGSHCAYFMER